jgi:hypothetical protein
MRGGWTGAAWAASAAVVAGLTVATSGSLSAQQNNSQAQPSIMVDQPGTASSQSAQPPKPDKSKRARVKTPAAERNPDLDAADELAPSQISQPMPARAAMPTRTHTTDLTAPPAAAGGPPAAAGGKPPRANPHLVVTCSGAFAKDSSHLKLAMAYDLKNVDFSEVDAGAGKTMASIIYPKDPKRRLEVWWQEPERRKDTYLIAINGQSTWAGPDGLRLGLNLADLEKLNRKPFKLRGFDKDSIASVTDWDGGTLSALPGGCKAGVMLRADAKVPPTTLSALPAEREFFSIDPAIRAANPAVSEILIGY